jgi:hypothetical protein
MKSRRLTPAYGRDYTSASQVREAWEASKDFIIEDVAFGDCGRYCSRSSAERFGLDEVEIRYNQKRDFVLIKVEREREDEDEDEGWEND